MEKLGDYDVVRMRVRLAEENAWGSPQALMVRYLGAIKDQEMLAAVGRLKKPVTIKDRRFGVLKLDRSTGAFGGKGTWGGRKVGVTLTADKSGSFEKSLKWAGLLFGGQRAWQPRISKRVIAELYPLWRKTWREEGDWDLDEKRFVSKLRMQSAWMEPDGAFSLWYDDADLFGGHSVVVRGKVSDGVKDVELQG
jgi:hypothetical protein